MRQIEPTYLHYIYDSLSLNTIHKDNISALPEGLIGLYEEAFDDRASVVEREKLLHRFVTWALLKKEVSTAFVSEILGEKEEVLQDFILNYSKWFNSPESGKYQLYHERFKVYLLSKISNLEIQKLSIQLIQLLRSGSKINEFKEYYSLFYIDHIVEHSYESSEFHIELENLVFKNEFWDNSFLHLKSILPAFANLRGLISYSCFKNDWKLLQRVSSLILFLEQKNDLVCENLLRFDPIDFQTVQVCYDSISSSFNRLRFLTYLNTKIELNERNKTIELNDLWDQMVGYVQSEYINGALFLPNWILQKLREVAMTKKINSLMFILNKIDLNDVDSISDSGILKSFTYLEDPKFIQSIPQSDFLCFCRLKEVLRDKSLDFTNAYNIISTPNLMDRDALLFKATLDFIESDYTLSYDWLYWLLVKSDFEWGGHTAPDEKYYTKNLLAKFISKADIHTLKKIQDLLNDIDLYNHHVLEIKCWISDRYFRIGNLIDAFDVLIQFNFEIKSTFDESEWKSAWFASQKLNFNIEELHVSKRLDTILCFPDKIENISFDEINTFLMPLDTDKVSKAEFFLETAVRVYKFQNKLGVKLVDAAWELINKTTDFASVIVKLETIVTGLNFMPVSWICDKLKRVKDDFLNNWKEYSDEYFLGIQNFYSYRPFRFSDRNILELSLESDSVRSFLMEFDKEGIEKAVQDEKSEKYIIAEAKKSKTFREFWSKVRIFFKVDNVGGSIDKFWTLFDANDQIFININAEDVRIIGVMSRKVNQHFPIELHVNKSEKLKILQDRINIPDAWEYGNARGFAAMVTEKNVDKVTICKAILGRPREGDEIFNTPIAAVGYMLNEIKNNKELVKNVQSFIELRFNLTNQC
jgi:hypothetical protein